MHQFTQKFYSSSTVTEEATPAKMFKSSDDSNSADDKREKVYLIHKCMHSYNIIIMYTSHCYR